MRKFFVSVVIVTLGSLSLFASPSQISQFSVPGAKQKAALQAAAHRPLTAAAGTTSPQSGSHSPVRASKVRPFANPPTSTIGFIAATDIPAGGAAAFPAVSGDVNGDGNLDIVTLVENPDLSFSISTVLSNGNGTFQAAILTPNPSGTSTDTVLLGDVNGDNKLDLLVVHSGSAPASFDVWLGNGQGSFTQGGNYAITAAGTGGAPTYSVVAGALVDVNADGKLDVYAVDNDSPADLITVLGNGDGTFSATPTSVALSGGVLSNIVFADLNMDGQIDLAASDGNNNGETVVFLANSGSFTPSAPLTLPSNTFGTCATAVGDLNGDGFPDLVTANCNNGYSATLIPPTGNDGVVVYLNNGDGSFQSGVFYAAASAGGNPAHVFPSAIALADVNGDGKLDVISNNTYAADMTILLGKGDGTLQSATVGYLVGGFSFFAPLVADFDGDGLADILVPDDLFSIAYLKGYGDGTFVAGAHYYSPVPADFYPNSVGMATGDLNGDGYPDFVLGNSGVNGTSTTAMGITVFLSNPDGTLQPGVNYGVDGCLDYVVTADFNGDGKLDLAAADCSGSGDVDVFLGNGDGTFQTPTTYSTGAIGLWAIMTGDFNGDGHPDLAVVTSANPTGSLGVLINDGTGNFLPAVPYPAVTAPTGYAVGDINGDGILDIIISGQSPELAVFLGNSDGTFQTATTPSISYSNLGNLALGDFNGDGKLDLAVAIDSSTAPGLAFGQGNGDGTFQPFVLYGATTQNWNTTIGNQPYPCALQAMDMNKDGHTDLVFTDLNYATVNILYNTGTGSFASGMFYDPVAYPAGKCVSFTMADVSNDGAPDAIIATGAPSVYNRVAGPAVLLNNSGSAVQPDFSFTGSPASFTVTAGNSASYNLSVTGAYGYAGTVSFTCSGLPSKSSCSFSPATVTANGHIAQPSALTISTTATTTTASNVPASKDPTLWATLGSFGIFGIMFAGSFSRRHRRIRRSAILLGILAIMIFTLALFGCGGSNGSSTGGGGGTTIPGTPAGSYPITVTATGSGTPALTHTVSVTLVVQ